MFNLFSQLHTKIRYKLYNRQRSFFFVCLFFLTHHVSQGLPLASTLTLEGSSPLIWFPLFKQLVRLVRRLNPLGDCSRHSRPRRRVAGVVNVTCLSADIQPGRFGLEGLGNFLLGWKNQKMVTDLGMMTHVTNIHLSNHQHVGSLEALGPILTWKHTLVTLLSRKNVDTTIILTFGGIKYDFPKVAGP